MLADLRYALRALRQAPGFAAVAILTLALAIGANVAIFSFIQAVFLRAAPVSNPARLMVFYSTAQERNGSLQRYLPSSLPNAQDYRRELASFSAIAISVPNGFNLEVAGKPAQVFGYFTTSDLFQVLGIRPYLGRFFSPAADGSPRPVAVLSYALWRKQFGADPGILGRSIQLDAGSYTVIGVAPRSFRGVGDLGSPGVLVPISMADQAITGISRALLHDRGLRLVRMEGRLRPGVTPAQAAAEVRTVALQLAREYPTLNHGRGEMMVPVNETNVPPARHAEFALAGALLMAIVGLVLLIACANVANLLLARARERRREIAVRLALGAAPGRLARQLLTESCLLALLAAAGGLLLAFWAKPVLLSLLPAALAQTLDVQINAGVLVFALGVALLATLLFGLAPALQSAQGANVAALRDRAAAAAGGGRWTGLRGALVTIQVALSLIALVGAGLFLHSLRNAENIDPGFNVRQEAVAFLNPGAARLAPPQAETFYRDLVARLDALPAVAGAAVSDTPPLAGRFARTTFPDGADGSDPRAGKLTPVVACSPGYFAATGMTLLRGRDFTAADDAQAPLVAVVNRAAAQAFWPGLDPLGRRLHFLGENWSVVVVGEVNTVKYATLGEPPQPIVYFPLRQHFAPAVMLFVRAKSGDPAALFPAIRGVVNSLAPAVPVLQARTMRQVLALSLTAPRTGAELLGAFGLLALMLAALGTYGVMSHAVSLRVPEIGLRMALGASPGGILRLVLGGGMTVVAVGVAAGLGLSLALARAMNSLLYGIGVFDPVSFLGTAALLVLVALAACYLPARRAMRVDPLVALRQE